MGLPIWNADLFFVSCAKYGVSVDGFSLKLYRAFWASDFRDGVYRVGFMARQGPGEARAPFYRLMGLRVVP